MQNSWLIENGRILDPAGGRDEVAPLLILDGRVAPAAAAPAGVPRIDARGLCVAPGFIDLHVHFREPGGEAAETIATGARAAARGGFTTVVTMPNTQPPTDRAGIVERVLAQARASGRVRVWPSACLTRGSGGTQPVDAAALAAAGAVCLTDDGTTPTDEQAMEAALRAAAQQQLPVLDHAQAPALAGDGVMHRGARSGALGLPGIPAEAEIEAVARDIRLCETTGCHIHIQHVSTRHGATLIAAAQARGLPVSGEATPHHLALTDEAVDGRDSNFKMNPPLRTEGDRQALLDAVSDGSLAALATDHAPHPAAAKAREFRQAPFGVVGLETAVGVTYTQLVTGGRLSCLEWVQRWTSGPAAILGRNAPSLQEGAPGDIVLLDLDGEWTVDPSRFASKSQNTPFAGMRLRGRAVCTLLEGIPTWQEGVDRGCEMCDT